MPKKPAKKIINLFLMITLSLNFYVWGNYFDFQQKDELQFVMFDVGQGDALYFRTPKGQDVLIDGGPDKKVLEKLASVMPYWDRKIELVILTHPHADHVTGLNDVFDRYEVERIAYTGVAHDTEVYKKFKQKMEEEGSEITILKRGHEISFGSDTVFSTIAPYGDTDIVKNINNSSVIGILKYKNFKIFLPGDAELEEIKLVLDDDIKSQVQKASHHGSSNGVTEKLLNKVNPELVLISVGKDNRYNHPHQEAVDLYEKFEAKILRTDERGTVKIITDGDKYKIQ